MKLIFLSEVVTYETKKKCHRTGSHDPILYRNSIAIGSVDITIIATQISSSSDYAFNKVSYFNFLRIT